MFLAMSANRRGPESRIALLGQPRYLSFLLASPCSGQRGRDPKVFLGTKLLSLLFTHVRVWSTGIPANAGHSSADASWIVLLICARSSRRADRSTQAAIPHQALTAYSLFLSFLVVEDVSPCLAFIWGVRYFVSVWKCSLSGTCPALGWIKNAGPNELRRLLTPCLQETPVGPSQLVH